MKKWEQLCKEYANENGFSYREIREIYNLYFKYLKDQIRNYDIYSDYTKEEFKEKFPIYRIHGIGTLYADYRRYKMNKQQTEKIYGKVEATDDYRSRRPKQENEVVGEDNQ